MLKGKLIYKDPVYGELNYDIVARDSFNDLKMQLTPGTARIEENYRRVVDNYDLVDGSVAEECKGRDYTIRRLDVKKTNKYKSNILNRAFATHVAALIRYMQISGKQNYNQQAVTEFSAKRKVNIIEPKTKKLLGVIAYNMGLITLLTCENKFLKLSLETVEDDGFQESIFKELKDKDKFGRKLSETPISVVGFKLDSDLLGFHYIPEVSKEVAQAFGMYETIEDVIANHPDKNTSYILERDYHIVTDENLDEVIKLFNDHDGMIAYDTETSGLGINFKSRTNEADQLVGVVLSRKSGEGFYFPLQHKLFPNLCDGDHYYFMDKYMRPILENKKIICHNLKFDWKVAYIYDINVNCVYDTMLAFGVTKGYEDPTFEIGLKALTKNIFGRDTFELSDFVMGGDFGDSEIAFWDLPYELVRQYAPADTDNTYSLYEFIEQEGILNKYDAKKVFEMEINFAKAVAYSEFYGYHIDVEKIPELQEKILGAMEKSKKEMFRLAGDEFNPSSPAQLVKIMYDSLGIEQIGEKQSTDKETLKALAQKTDAEGNVKYPFVKALKDFRDNEGIYKNFLKKLSTFATSDGFIFPDVLQIGTTTGRVSVKNPNYQSYNDIVKHYVVPRSDYLHFDSDFAQIEQRVLTSYACIMFPDSDPLALLHDFDDPDMDYHQYQAARMFNVPYAAVSKAMRQQSKGINFGLPYGMGDESLGARIFGERTPENTRKAADLRKKFFQGQELIDDFFTKVRSEGVRNGFTSTQWGRRRYYQKGVFSIAEIRRQAGNHVIQGTAADIYKIAVNNMFNRICKEGWLGKVLINGFIHDEMLMEVHKSINPYYFFKAWREEFEVKPAHYCRLYAGAGIGYCWYDAKKLDLPPMYIDDIINLYDEDMEWNGNFDEFLNTIKVNFKKHKINRIKTYITDEKSQNDILKPAINALLVDEIPVILKEIVKNNEKIAELNSLLTDNKIDVDTTFIKGLQDQLRTFCYHHNIDYDNINILSPEDVPVQTNDYVDDLNSDDVLDIVIDKEQYIHVSLLSKGIFIDEETRTVHMAEILINTEKGWVQGTKYFIENFMLVPVGKDTKGYKIMYYKTVPMEGSLQGQGIESYCVPFDNGSVLMHYYTEMLSMGFARLVK